MQTKILSLLHVLSIGAIINPLHGYQNQSRHYSNSNTEWTLTNLLELGVGAVNFLKQNQHYIEQEVPNTTPQSGNTYDFIIIGAGTAGATLAARLSESSQFKVLLIEASIDENLFMDIPVLAAVLQAINTINWNYQTKPSNKYCRGMKYNSCPYPRGKVVSGGSSVLNFMIASRGGAKDYDR